MLGARSSRRAPTWGCGGELTAETEYTATAFAKPLVMVFRDIYRPTREVSTAGDDALLRERGALPLADRARPSSASSTRPLTRAVLAAAGRLRIIQAGSLHAYLAYVLVLGVMLLWWLGGLP